MASTSDTTDARRRSRPHPVWSALVGPASLGVLLQGRWAGLFPSRDSGGSTSLGRSRGGGVALHVPLPMQLTGPAVWSPMTARRG